METANPQPPGPKSPAIVQTLRWATRPAELLSECAEHYGNIFVLNFSPTGKWVFTSEPDDIQKIFRANPDDVPSATSQSIITPVVGGNSLLILNGKEHLRQRKLLLPPFHGDRMKTYGEIITQVTERELAKWPLGTPFKLAPRMQAITLEVIERAVFGVTDEEDLERMRSVIVQILGLSQSPLAIPFIIGNIGREEPRGMLKRIVARLDREIYAEIARHRQDPNLEQREDILSLLLQARDEEGEAMSDKELRDELVTLLLAGHETTASALAWAFERLTRTPTAMDRLRESLKNNETDYLDAVIEETMRSRPIVPIVSRKLTVDMKLSGYEFPAGSLIAPSIFGIHHRPDLYPDPVLFRPERFIEKDTEIYSWIPFGGGVRRCIGAAFANFEMKTVISTIFEGGFRLRAVNPEPEPIRRRNVTFIPSRGTLVIAERRDP